MKEEKEDPVVKVYEFRDRFSKEVFPHLKRFLDENKSVVNTVLRSPEQLGAEHVGLLILLRNMKVHDEHADAYQRAQDAVERKDRLYWMAVKEFQTMQTFKDILHWHLTKGTPYSIDPEWARSVLARIREIERTYKPHYQQWLGFAVTPEEKKDRRFVRDVLSGIDEL